MKLWNMKSLIAIVSFAVIAQGSWAALYMASGPVKQVQSLDRVVYGANDSFSITGFGAAGSCALNDGLVGIVLRDDEGGKRQLSILLSARMSNIPVTVRVDDSVKNSAGYCYLQLISL